MSDDPFSFDYVPHDPVEQPAAKFEDVCVLPNGAMLYRQANGAGGYTYWSDEIGGGVMVWDTCCVDKGTLLAAMAEEHRRERAETVSELREAIKDTDFVELKA